MSMAVAATDRRGVCIAKSVLQPIASVMSSTPPDELRDRIQRLEEHAGFREHEIEQLSAALGDLSGLLERAIKRIEALEGRLGRLETPADAPSDPAADRPPHY